MRNVATALGTIVLFLGISAGRTSGDVPLPGRVCTLMGCTSGVSIDVRQVVKSMPAAWTIDVCIEHRCSHDHLYEPDVPALRSYESVNSRTNAVRGVARYVISIAVRDRNGQVLFRAGRIVTMKKHYPNGKECEGLCFARALKLTANHELVVKPS